MANSITKILVATDGSEGATRAIQFTESIALPLAAQVTVLTVHNDDVFLLNAFGPSVWPAAIPDDTFDLDALRAATEKQTNDTLLTEIKSALAALADVNFVQIWGHPSETICTYAGDHSIDLVIIGSRGHSVFKRLLLGSISAQVAQHSPCPVTIVH